MSDYLKKQVYRLYDHLSLSDVAKYELLEVVKSQKDKCLICGEPDLSMAKDNICADRSSYNEKLRGLLCFQCSSGLSAFKEKPYFLLKAAQYLSFFDNYNENSTWLSKVNQFIKKYGALNAYRLPRRISPILDDFPTEDWQDDGLEGIQKSTQNRCGA